MSTIYDKIVQVYRKILGFINGKADLVNGKVPAGQLPDDWNDVQDFDVKDNPAEGETAFPEEGIAGVLYVEKSTNKAYRWSITERKYVEVGNAAQVQSDWNEQDANKKSFIRNKPNVAREPVYSDTPTYGLWYLPDPLLVNYTHVSGPVYNRDFKRWELRVAFRGTGLEELLWGEPSQGEDATRLVFATSALEHRAPEDPDQLIVARTAVYPLVGYRFGGQDGEEFAALSVDRCAELYPDGSVRGEAEFTQDLKYAEPDTENGTVEVLTFANLDGTAARDNSNLAGRVVIPPYKDIDGVRYTVTGVAGVADASVGVVTGYDSGPAEVVAPVTVTTLGNGAFIDCGALVSVSFPGVAHIGDYAFSGCHNIRTALFPAAEYVGGWAFRGCYFLSTVAMPKATSVGDSAFYGCSGLVAISFPAATHLSDEAFSGCSSLVSVDCPRVWGLGNGGMGEIFSGCTRLASIELPCVQYVAPGTFAGCTSLITVSLPSARSVDAGAFIGCIALTAVSLPSCTSLVARLFQGCTALSSVSLPAVTSVGQSAFQGCTALTSVSLPAAASVEQYAFQGCTALSSVSLPAATSVGDYMFSSCVSLVSVSFPAATSVGTSAFQGCTALTSVSLPAAMSIGTSAFQGCAALSSVSLPAAETIRAWAFAYCTSLESVDLPAFTTFSNTYMFAGCSSLVSVAFPSVTGIGIVESTFASCPRLSYVDYGATPRSAVPGISSAASRPGYFGGAPSACAIFVPDAQYDDWVAPTMPDPDHEGETKANPWYALVQAGYRFFKHSELAAVKAYEAADFFPIKWADLKLLRDTGGLVPGRQYRITDYVATTNGAMKSVSANNPFDIVVAAVDERTLNERARAVMHEPPVDDFSTSRRYYVGDYCRYVDSVYRCTVEHYGSWKSSHFEKGAPYFYDSKLEAWEVWYCLDNDTSRFAWALAAGATDPQTGTTGRGVVYRLIDEFKNDLPYDFKGLKFIPYGDASGAYYTFGASVAEPGLDRSLTGASGSDACCCNTVRPYVDQGTMVLNRIVFKGGWARDNTFGPGCHDITTGTRADYNTFGPGCYNNIVSSSFRYNSFGNCCHDNYLGAQCQAVVFGNYCYNNILGRCNNVSFGVSCVGNVFGASYAAAFSDTATCTVGSLYRRDGAFYRCDSPYLGRFTATKAYAAGDFVGIYDSATSSYSYYRLPEGHEAGVALADTPHEAAQLSDFLTAVASPALSYYRFIRFGDHVTYVCLESTASRSSTRFYQNVTVADGVAGTAAEPKHIQDPNREQVFRTTYQTSDSQVVNI